MTEASRTAAVVVRSGDRLVDAFVALLATWTLVYHLCLVLRLPVPWAVGLELGALALVGLASTAGTRGARSRPGRRPPVGNTPGSTPGSRVPAVAALVLSAPATVLMAVDRWWPAMAVAWVLSGLAAATWAWRSAGSLDGRRPRTAPVDTGAALLAGAWAVGLAGLATVLRRPNPDDLYYVNLAQWVVDHGTFPVRDTIFSDLRLPMSSWPPVASYDALTGTVARLAGVPAGSVVYVVVPPVTTALAVLSLWALVRAWRVPRPGLVLSVALVFLLLDGGGGYAAPGLLFLTRLWQGKVILLCVLVPVLLVRASRFAQAPSRRGAVGLAAGGVAAVGLSTTAMFLVPLLALGAAAPLLRHPRRAGAAFASMAAYPLLAGAVTTALGGRSADDFGQRRTYRFDPAWFGHEIFRSGTLAVVAVSAVLLGALLLPQRRDRVTVAVLTVLVGVTFLPGVTRVAYDLVGLGPTLWRVSWLVPVAALVGVLATLPVPLRRRAGPWLLPAVVCAALAVAGTPLWSGSSGATWKSPGDWQRSERSLAVAALAVEALPGGGVVLAPEDVAITLSVLTTRVKTVAPRDYFMEYLQDDPSFHYADRLLLLRFADPGGPPGAGGVRRALDVVGVDEVCLPADDPGLTVVRDAGFTRSAQTAGLTCLAR